MKIGRRTFNGSAKKGLHPGSVVHFRLDETSGDTLYDAVQGATLVRAANTLRYDVPNAVSHLASYNGGAEDDAPKRLITNQGSIIQSLSNLTSKYLVLYTTAKFIPVYSNVVRAGGLCAVVDFSDGGGFYLEVLGNTEGLPEVFGAAQDYSGTRNGKVDFAKIEDGTLPKSPWETPAYTHITLVDFETTGNSFKLADSNGYIDFIKDRSNPEFEGQPFTIETGWDLTKALTMTLANVEAYTTGAIYLASRPSDEDLLECAYWHNTNAPKGQKDVWPGWNKYKSGL